MVMERGQFPPWGQAAPLQVRAEVRIAATKPKRPIALIAAPARSAVGPRAAMVGSIARARAFATDSHNQFFDPAGCSNRFLQARNAAEDRCGARFQSAHVRLGSCMDGARGARGI